MAAIFTFSPAFAFFFAPQEAATLAIDIRRFARMVNGTLRPGPERLLISPTAADVRAVVENGEVAVDIETGPAAGDAEGHTGKDPLRATLKTIGLGNTRWGLSYWWADNDSVMVATIAEVLADATITKVFQNGWWFDIPCLGRYGFEIK